MLHKRVGAIYADHLEAFAEAISHLEQVRQATAPGGEERTDALASLYERQQGWDEVVSTLQAQAELAGTRA